MGDQRFRQILEHLEWKNNRKLFLCQVVLTRARVASVAITFVLPDPRLLCFDLFGDLQSCLLKLFSLEKVTPVVDLRNQRQLSLFLCRFRFFGLRWFFGLSAAVFLLSWSDHVVRRLVLFLEVSLLSLQDSLFTKFDEL